MAKEKNNKRSRIPNGYNSEDKNRRISWLKDHTGFNYKDSPVNPPEELKGIIENHIGYMKIPMAVAGPMQLDGQYAKGEFFVPICTLEGTLAISMTRGMYASSESGGIRVRHVKQELSRAPVFIFEDLNDSF